MCKTFPNAGTTASLAVVALLRRSHAARSASIKQKIKIRATSPRKLVGTAAEQFNLHTVTS